MNKKVKSSELLRPGDDELLAVLNLLSNVTPTGYQKIDTEFCKYCKYFNENSDDSSKNGDCMIDAVWVEDVNPEHYCSRFASKVRHVFGKEPLKRLVARDVMTDILSHRFGVSDYLDSDRDEIKKTFEDLRRSTESGMNEATEDEAANVNACLNALRHTEDWLLAIDAEYNAEEKGGEK